MGYSNLLAEDKRLVTYRPRLNEITGSVTATVLLQQIIFHADNVGNRPFYKFRTPCKHKLYREGDSWTEELGFSPAEFDTARSKIATRIMKGDSKAEALKGETANHLVLYWTDASRVTWYMLNVELLNKILGKLYADSRNSNYQESGKSPSSESQDSGNTRKLEKQDLPLSETPTETPTEDTEKTKPDFPEKPKSPAPPPDPGGDIDSGKEIDDVSTSKIADGSIGNPSGTHGALGTHGAYRDSGEAKADSVVEAIIAQTETRPGPEDLARRTAAARAEAGAWSDPASFALGDRLVAVACARLGRSEPQGKKRDNAVAFFKKALKDEGLLQGDVDMLERAVKDWLDPEGEYAFFRPQYELTVKHKLALRHFGIVLSKAKACADAGPAGRYARTAELAAESQAALRERMASRKKPVKGDSIWEAAKRELQLQMTKATFDVWVKDTYGLPQGDGVYTVVTPNERTRDWLDNRLKTTAQRTLVGILDEQVEVRFEVEP